MKKRVRRLCIAGAVFVAACLLHGLVPGVPELLQMAVFLTAYLLAGYKVLRKAVRNIIRGSVFDENFLMAVASIGAFCIGEYPEAVAVMLFYQVGECFEDFAVGKSRKSIADLMNIRPDFANLLEEGAEGEDLREVDPEEVQVGQTILVRPGEKIPLDGIVLEGESMVDTAALTGESVPRDVASGSEILSGCINLNGVLKVQVTKPFGESTVSKILDLVENATMKKARTENFITRFAAVYTPVVVITAVALAVVPTLVVPGAVFSDWLYRALNFLVVSCPCALVISVPLSFFGGIGGASREGILVKGSSYLEIMADAKIAVMDKTGTLTRGVFDVVEIQPAEGFGELQLLEFAAAVESYSSHPISESLKRAWLQRGEAIDTDRLEDVREIAGHGVTALLDGKPVAAGNGKLMKQLEVECAAAEEAGTVVHVAVEGKYAGYILIADQLKPDAKKAIAQLRAKGVRTVMLTGDSRTAGEAAAQELGMDEVYCELLPGDKVDKVEELLTGLGASADGAASAEKKHRGRLIFVGDGINDAPVLSRADIGIAMGALGSDAAIEAADVVLMDDDPLKVVKAIRIARKCLRIVYENIYFAIGIKVICLILGALGIANMWVAIFADVGVMVIAVLNAIRTLFVKKL